MPQRPILTNRSSAALQRSKSPLSERLYWHDSEVVLYHNQQRSVIQQHQMKSDLSSGNISGLKTNSQRRPNGWFSDCECNMLLGGFDATNVV